MSIIDLVWLSVSKSGGEIAPCPPESFIRYKFRGFEFCGVPYVYINREIQGMPVCCWRNSFNAMQLPRES